eukprot:m.53034 g.53034  ORF g.53034 m.53034 type:complete len:429 (+) comp10836_c1_seq2:109-1395(+)
MDSYQQVVIALLCVVSLKSSHPLASVFNVKEFGAKGDGETYDTAPIRTACIALHRAGGGTLLFPAPGTYLTGAFNISSNTVVYVAQGAKILGSTRGDDWPLLVARDVWPQMGHGSDCVPGDESCRLMHQALLFSWHTNNVTVTGGGEVDCNSKDDTWWKCAKNLAEPPCNGYGRPHCVMFSNSTSVIMSHLTVQNSPDWTLHFSGCTTVHVHDLNVLNPIEPNADGIDVDASQEVLVENNYFSVGDDALCVKSGIDYFGRIVGRPSKNIIFRNNLIGTGHGITIGSETSGGVQNVTFENITMNKTGTGIRMKSQRGRGGVVQDIVYRNINMIDIEGQCIQTTLNYHHDIAPTNASATPVLKNVLIENVYCKKAGNSYLLDGLPEQHILNFSLRNVTLGSEVGKEAGCDNIDCTCVKVSPCPSCCKVVN